MIFVPSVDCQVCELDPDEREKKEEDEADDVKAAECSRKMSPLSHHVSTLAPCPFPVCTFLLFHGAKWQFVILRAATG